MINTVEPVFKIMPDDPDLRRLLWFLLGGTKGGESRAEIIHQLKQRPSNLNQLSKKVGLQYKAVQHHMGVLRRSSLVVDYGEKYGMTYFLSPWFEAHFEVFEEICKKLGLEFAPSSDADNNPSS